MEKSESLAKLSEMTFKTEAPPDLYSLRRHFKGRKAKDQMPTGSTVNNDPLIQRKEKLMENHFP